jgi:hypothetical protein
MERVSFQVVFLFEARNGLVFLLLDAVRRLQVELPMSDPNFEHLVGQDGLATIADGPSWPARV